MGFYDIMDEIAQKSVTKTETGDNRIFGVLVGVVVKNYDEKMPGRVCVRIPVRDKEANELQWARVAFASGGKSWGSYFIPEVDDEVLLVFEQGLIDKPYIIGCVNKDNDKLLSQKTHEKNQVKSIVTRYGSTIQFDDVEGEDADKPENNKDKISIFTCKSKHQIIIDNEENSILISDQKKNNMIKMTTAENEGNIAIKCTDKLSITVGDGTKVTMDKDGNVNINASNVTIKASEGFGVESNQKMSLEGANVNVKGSSGISVQSSGVLTLAGSPVKVG